MPTDTPEQRYMTSAELADLLRVPVETVRTWRKLGRGPKSFRIPGGRRVLYAVNDVEQFIAAAQGLSL